MKVDWQGLNLWGNHVLMMLCEHMFVQRGGFVWICSLSKGFISQEPMGEESYIQLRSPIFQLNLIPLRQCGSISGLNLVARHVKIANRSRTLYNKNYMTTLRCSIRFSTLKESTKYVAIFNRSLRLLRLVQRPRPNIYSKSAICFCYKRC